MKAAEVNRVDIMRLLLEGRADIAAVSNRGRTALSFAAAPSNAREDNRRRPTAIDAVQLLLSQGADVLQRDKDGMTAEDRARAERRWDAVAILAEAEIEQREVGLLPPRDAGGAAAAAAAPVGSWVDPRGSAADEVSDDWAEAERTDDDDLRPRSAWAKGMPAGPPPKRPRGESRAV